MVAFTASLRYRSLRFACVTVALAILATVGALGAFGQLAGTSETWLGLGTVLGGLLLVSELLLYVSLVAGGPRSPPPATP